jgi:streptogramin lyase
VTRTPSRTPTPTPTPVIPLILSNQCSDDPAVARVWKVHNSNGFAVPFTWKVYGIPVSGTDPISWNPFVLQQGTGTAAPNTDTIFASPTVKGLNPAAIFWTDKRSPLGFGFWLSLSTTAACATPVSINPQPGSSVNMVSGTSWPGGDPFLQRQNEGSGAFSTRNPQHLIAGANDYRSVDIPFPAVSKDEEYAGDAWVGLFKSFDGGQTWQSTLLPGFPQDPSPEGNAFRSALGLAPGQFFGAGADPVVRAGVAGLFHYAGIVFNRSADPDGNPTEGALFVATLIDLNNKENGDATQSTDPIRLVGVSKVESTTSTNFIDKPAMAVDTGRGDLAPCSLNVPQGGGFVAQTIPAGRVYVAYSSFSGVATGQIFLRTSSDCGQTWGPALPISTASQHLSQGSSIGVDPATGNVFVAWRQFAVGMPGQPGYQPNAMNVVKVTGGGTTAGPVMTVKSLDSYTTPFAESFFDQVTTQGTFRTNAYPSLAIDGSGRVYLAWAQRKALNGDARIMLSTYDGTSWSAPSFVDDNPVVDEANPSNSFTRGHEFMPQVTFNNGRLTVVYYDLHLDHTLGLFDAVPGYPKPDALGRFELETRSQCNESPTPAAPCAGETQLTMPLTLAGAPVFTPFISDTAFTDGVTNYPPLTLRRHTLDMRLAQAGPGAAPVFTTKRLSNYKFGTRGDEVGSIGALQQLQVNPPNLPMFGLGTVPFFSDYIDVLGVPFVQTSPGGPWSFNTGNSKSGTQFAIWTSNQDVVPPYNSATGDVDWTQYTPPFSAANNGISVYDGSAVPPCLAPYAGSRNQNIYGALITQDFVFSSPQNSKPLSTTLQRAFVIAAQNMSNFDKTFRLVIQNQPPSGWASFKAGTNVPLAAPSPVVTTLDLAVAAHSVASRSVFATSSSPTANITVDIAETSSLGGPLVVNGLTGFIVLNSDATTPGLVPPDGGGSDPGTVEVYTPNVTNPNVTNPNVTNPNVTNPNVTNPNVTNPNVTNTSVGNPNVTNADIASLNPANPNVTNPNVTNPNVTNPNVTNVDPTNPNVTNQSVSDTVYNVSSGANTSASYRIALVGNAPPGVTTQLIITKTYKTPSVLDCQLFEQDHELLLTNVVNPVFLPPGSNLNDPATFDGSIGNATVNLKPGESATIILRAFSNTPLPDGLTQIAPVVVAQAANTNDPTNTPVAVGPGGTTITGGLQILTAALPDAVVGVPYSASLVATGGTPTYSWDSTSSPPPGLTLLGTGQITGTPTGPPGTTVFTVRVFDSAASTGTSSRGLSIRVTSPLSFPAAALAAGTVGAPYAASVSATGGAAPYTFSLIAGTLPLGLNLSAGGAITGAPAVAGTSNFTLGVRDTENPQQMKLTSFSITVNSAAPPTSPALVGYTQPAKPVANVPFSVVFHAQDAAGNPIQGANVTIMSFDGSPCAGVEFFTTGDSALTDVQGNASFSGRQLDSGGNGYAIVAQAVAPGFPTLNGSAIFNAEGYCNTANMATNRYEHVAVRLNDGRVLLAGGTDSAFSVLASGEIYDPVAKTFTSTATLYPGPGPAGPGNMSNGRRQPAAALLPDGRVLIAGGTTNLAGSVTTSLFDPLTGFSVGPNMPMARLAPTLTTLPNSLVLLAGGLDNSPLAQTSAQLFDPSTNAFTADVLSLNAGRYYHTATLLKNGLVLIAGGYGLAGGPPGALSSAELYDPVAKTFATIPVGMVQARGQHTATLLKDGRVLLAGGILPGSDISLTTAEIYDPVANSFSATGALINPLGAHAAALLPSGKVLVAGGACCGDTPSIEASHFSEIWDPATGAWAFTGDQFTFLAQETATLLLDGTVLVAGGTYSDGTGTRTNPAAVAASELYYPGDDAAFAVGDMATGRLFHTATRLFNGKVLIAGGSTNAVSLASAELYDPATHQFTATGGMGTARVGHSATLLGNGKVLIAGGGSAIGAGDLNTAELYDPATGLFTPTGSFAGEHRQNHGAALLYDGRVLVVGGISSDTSSGLKDAELYDPASGGFTQVDSFMTHERIGGFSTTLLYDGRVLVAGGYPGGALPVGGSVQDADIFDPTSVTFTIASSNMLARRAFHSATLQTNGQVLLAGGENDTGFLSSGEYFDPSTNTFVNSIPNPTVLSVTRDQHTGVRMFDGRTLLSGGVTLVSAVTTPLKSQDLIGPGAFLLSGGGLPNAFWNHTATPLSDGSVLLAGGSTATSLGNAHANLQLPSGLPLSGATPAFTAFGPTFGPLTLSDPVTITVGPDGALWFTELAGDRIGRLTTSGALTEYPMPGLPYGITPGPDGNLWFTVSGSGASAVGRMTPSGTSTLFPVPSVSGFGPANIVTGPDGNLWFTHPNDDKVGKMTTAGVVTEYSTTAGALPVGIAVGPDGNLWFTELNADKIGRVTTSGALTEFPITAGSKPSLITRGPDGNLWYTSNQSGAIGRITTAGVVTDFPVSPTSGVQGITAGPDGAIWFTELDGNAIGRMQTDGTLTHEIAVPPSLNTPVTIVTGPDGAMWFAARTPQNAIGRLQ